MKIHPENLVASIVVVSVLVVSLVYCTASAQDIVQEEAEEEPSYPLLIIGGNLGASAENNEYGHLVGNSFLSLDLSFDTDTDWVYGGVRILGEVGSHQYGDLNAVAEISGYVHLLAIGVSDITYRRYIDGHEFRLLAGFSYTKHVEDIVRVDVNLGFAYFDEQVREEHIDQFGLQVGARITANVWQIHNTFSLSVFQNVRLNDAEIDLSDIEIVCENFDEVLLGGDLICTFSDPPEDGGGSILSWEHTGVILQNRTYMWLLEEDDFRFGPELEIRFEHVPLRQERFTALLSVRGQWHTR